MKTFSKLSLLLIFGITIIFVAFPLRSQSLDHSFLAQIEKEGDIEFIKKDGLGGLFVYGSFHKLNDNFLRNRKGKNLIRLDSDFNFDAEFIASDSFDDFDISKIIPSGNKFLVKALSGRDYVYLMNLDGSLDESFQLDESILSLDQVIFYENGYYATAFMNIDNVWDYFLIRLNLDGSIDSNFGTHVFTSQQDIFLQKEGQLLFNMPLNKTTYDHQEVDKLFRINIDGTIDKSFNLDADLNIKTIRIVSILDDGAIICWINDANFGKKYVKLNPDGELDENFDGSGLASITDNYYISIVEDSNAKLYAIKAEDSGASANHIQVYKLNSNGIFDNDFNESPIKFTDSAKGILEIINGELVVAGHFITEPTDPHFSFLRMDLNGNVLSDKLDFLQRGSVFGVKSFENSDIVIHGSFSLINNQTAFNLAKLNPQGQLVYDFQSNINDVFWSKYTNLIGIQDDSKIVIRTHDFNGGSIFRLNSDGSYDEGFTQQNFKQVYEKIVVHLLNNDRLLVSGTDLHMNNSGNGYDYVVRLEKNGQLDNSFQSEIPVLEGQDAQLTQIQDIAASSNGTYILGGFTKDFNVNGGKLDNLILIINPDGSINNTVQQLGNTGSRIITTVASGNDRFFSGENIHNISSPIHLTQYSNDGTIIDDQSIYLPQSSFILSMLPLESDALLVGGTFDQLNGESRNNLAKTSYDGILDPLFNFDINGSIQGILRYDHDHILIAGNFNEINDIPVMGIAKIKITNTAPTISGTATQLSTDQNKPLEIKLSDLLINDPDETQESISFRVLAGENYSFKENTILPTLNYTGELLVKVRASDNIDEGEITSISIKVNPVAGPHIVTSTPSNNSSDFNSKILSFEFDEPIHKGNGSIQVTDRQSEEVFFSIGVNHPSVEINNNVVSIKMKKMLPEGKTVSLSISEHAFKNEENIFFSGLTSGSLTFSTNSSPLLIQSVPSNHSTDFSNSKISLTFNEAIKKGSGTIQVKNYANDNVLFSIGVNHPDVQIQEDMVVINMRSFLPTSTEAYISIPPMAFSDMNGTNFEGTENKNQLNFSTDYLPVLSSSLPADNSIEDQPINSISLTFSEPVEKGMGLVEVINSENENRYFSHGINYKDISVNGNTVTIILKNEIPIGNTAYITLGSKTIKDQNGNFFEGISDPNVLNFSAIASSPSSPVYSNIFVNEISSQETGIGIYPNPASENITVNVSKIEGPLSLELISSTGASEHQQALLGQQKINLDVSSIPEGMHILVIKSLTQVFKEKLIIKR